MLVDINFLGQDSKQYWLDLLPRDSNDVVTGSVHVSVAWHHNNGVCVRAGEEKRGERGKRALIFTFRYIHQLKATRTRGLRASFSPLHSWICMTRERRSCEE